MKTNEVSLYEILGGEGTIQTVVDEFYKRVLADDTINYLFNNTDMEKQRRHLTSFISFALGGPEYKGRTMRAAHQGLDISSAQFQAVASHLVNTLTALQVDQAYIDQIVAKVAPLEKDIVERV